MSDIPPPTEPTCEGCETQAYIESIHFETPTGPIRHGQDLLSTKSGITKVTPNAFKDGDGNTILWVEFELINAEAGECDELEQTCVENTPCKGIFRVKVLDIDPDYDLFLEPYSGYRRKKDANSDDSISIPGTIPPSAYLHAAGDVWTISTDDMSEHACGTFLSMFWRVTGMDPEIHAPSFHITFGCSECRAKEV